MLHHLFVKQKFTSEPDFEGSSRHVTSDIFAHLRSTLVKITARSFLLFSFCCLIFYLTEWDTKLVCVTIRFSQTLILRQITCLHIVEFCAKSSLTCLALILSRAKCVQCSMEKKKIILSAVKSRAFHVCVMTCSPSKEVRETINKVDTAKYVFS